MLAVIMKQFVKCGYDLIELGVWKLSGEMFDASLQFLLGWINRLTYCWFLCIVYINNFAFELIHINWLGHIIDPRIIPL